MSEPTMTAEEVISSLRRLPWAIPVRIVREEGGRVRFACRACLAVVPRAARYGSWEIETWGSRAEHAAHVRAEHPELLQPVEKSSA